MKIVFLGTGPTNIVEGRGKNRRLNSSVYIEAKGKKFIIDVTPYFSQQIKENKINDIDFVLITHAHRDAVGGIPQLVDWLKKKGKTIPLFCEKLTWQKIKQKFKDLSNIEHYTIRRDNKFMIDDLEITPVRVCHSIQPGFPTVAYKIDGLMYSEDLGAILPENKSFFEDIDYWIIDAAMYFGRQIKGHQSIESALELVKKYKPKVAILIQAGHTYPDHDIAEKEIQTYWKKLCPECKTKIILAYDGMVIDTKELAQTPGIYLPAPHAKWLWQGKKTLIIKAKNYKNMTDRTLFVCDNRYVYGVIRLHPPHKISLKEFKERQHLHLVSDEEAKKWWGNRKEFWEYSFEWIDKFEEPKRWKWVPGTQTFIDKIEFINKELDLIQNPETYDPKQLPTDVLKDDWRIINSWYSTLKRKGKFKYSEETIVNLAKLIYNELLKRGIKFHPEKYKKYALDLYKRVAEKNAIIHEQEPDITTLDFVDNFEDFTIIKDFASIVGSTVKRPKDKKPNDVDIHFRLSDPPSYIRRAVEVRMLKMLEAKGQAKLADKLHFIWGDPEGSHDDFLPLYDLRLIRVKPAKVVKMSALEPGARVKIGKHLGTILTKFKLSELMR